MHASDPDEIAIDVPGMTLTALAWGEPDAKPVLGLHGWLDNAATMARLAPCLDELRLVALDFPGHGRSDHRARGDSYHFVDLVPTIFDVANELGWNHFSILGHSMGAGAGLLAAGTRPDRIERLALIDGIGPWSTPAERSPSQFADGLDERETLLDKQKRTFEEVDDAIDVIAETYGIDEETVGPMVRRNLERADSGDWQFTYDLMLRGTSLLRLTEPQVLAFLERIDAPALLVRPESGWPVEDDDFQRRTEAVEGLRVERIEGPHHVHLAAPAPIADLVVPFLT